MNSIELQNLKDFSASGAEDSNPRRSLTGKILIGVTGGIAVGLTILCAPFVSPALRKICLPYVPATEKQINNIFKALDNCKGTLIDLGSGDGRIVLEAARRNFNSHGVELNPWLVVYSKFNSLWHQLDAKFFHRDLWKFHVGGYDNIVIFGVEQMMADLEVKLLNECHPDCKVVACRFPLPNLRPACTIGSGIDAVWVYSFKNSAP